MREKLWIIEYLTIEAFIKKQAFWKDLFKECEMSDVDFKEDITMSLLISKGILTMREKVEDISRRAEKSWSIEKKLIEMFDRVREVKIEVSPYKGTYIFKSVEDI